MHILVVDDIEANRVRLRTLLEAAGHTIAEAADGAEALRLLADEAIEAIISDVFMPYVDGFQLCLEVRKSDRLGSLPFIIHTNTRTSAADRELAMEVGADFYLEKPAPDAVILETLARLSGLPVPRNGRPARSPDEVTVIKHHNAALVTRLEQKNQELMQAIAELRTSEERFRQLTENIHEVFWLGDPENNAILYISPAYAPIWGRTCAALLAAPASWIDAVHPEDRERVLQTRTKKLSDPCDDEYRIVRPDGAVRWIRDRMFPVRNADGCVYRVAGVAEDVTKRRQLETQVFRTQRFEAIGKLAGGIAHDLNNILAPIVMSAPLLRQGAGSGENEKILATVESSARRGVELVRRLLAFSRGADGPRKILRLEPLVREIADLARDTFPRHVTIDVEIDTAAWPVRGDATQLHQVLLNLCVNARDAMPQGGDLKLRVENIRLGADATATNPDARPGPYAVLHVADTGTGIAPEIVDQIFEPFFTTKETGKGTGLGLSTVFEIVKNHGGFLTLQSAVGRGATFRVHLPAMPDVEPPPADPVPPEARRGRGEGVLIIEPDEGMREVLGALLVRHGYRVWSATDGVAGLQQCTIDGRQIDAVVLDLDAPALDGTKTIHALKQLNATVKVIVATGKEPRTHPPEFTAALAFSPGCSILKKPYTAEKLLRHLAEILGPNVTSGLDHG